MVAMNARLLPQVPNWRPAALAPNPAGLSTSAQRIPLKSLEPSYKVKLCMHALQQNDDSERLHERQKYQNNTAQHSSEAQAQSSEALVLEALDSKIDRLAAVLLHVSTSVCDSVKNLLSDLSSDVDSEEEDFADLHRITKDAMKWFRREKGYVVEDWLPEDCLDFTDNHNQHVVTWGDVFKVQKDDKRILVLVEDETMEFMSREELQDKFQKTKDYLQALVQNPPTADNPYTYNCLYNFVGCYSDFTQVVVVFGTPEMDGELLQFADAHGMLCMLRDYPIYVMQPTKVVP